MTYKEKLSGKTYPTPDGLLKLSDGPTKAILAMEHAIAGPEQLQKRYGPTNSCPYEQFIVDESSGIVFDNPLYRAWHEGYKAKEDEA